MADPAPLRDQSIAITGRLASMTREEAIDLIRECGGTYRARPGRDCRWLVVGQEGWAGRAQGETTRHLERARDLRHEGVSLEIVEEQEFLELARLSGVDAAPELRTLHTTAQLARILDIPGSRIRRWVRRGWIQPARVQHRLEYFDFRQVAAVKVLRQLQDAGVEVSALRKGLSRLTDWFPDEADGLGHLRRLVLEDRLLIRQDDGTLMEPDGQLRLPFADAAARTVVALPERPDDGLAAEEDGDLEAARDAYREALELDPAMAETWFDLGNVLYALGDHDEAVDAFTEAVSLEDNYAEAWNNLASVLTDTGEAREAIHAAQRAVALAPDYADAHYNLAQAYAAAGWTGRARVHAEVYFRFDRTSEFAEHLRQLLRDTDR